MTGLCYKVRTVSHLHFLSLGHSRPVFSRVSAEAKELLAGMLCVDPTKRLSASECLLHPWITGKCHGPQHKQALPEVQEHMMQRIERRRRKAAERK